MTPLPGGVDAAFRVAVSELGMCAAAWMFVEEVAAVGGPDLVAELRLALGVDWPVLDAVASAWLSGEARPPLAIDAVLEVIGPASRIVCVGLEVEALDRLLEATDAPVWIVRESVFGPDWARVQANYEGRVGFEGLDTFQRLAGPRSVLLTFGYGTDDRSTHVLPAWIRASGEDVRTRFRSLVLWEVLHRPFQVWPRWLVEVPLEVFSSVVR